MRPSFLIPAILLLVQTVGSAAPKESPADRLFQAAASHQVALVRALLKQGVDSNAPNTFRTPPLVAAASGNTRALETVQVLLDAGARVDAPDGEGRTALLAAAGIDLGDYTEQQRLIEILDVLLQRGANVNYRSPQGETALSAAAHAPRFHALIVRALLARGADPTVSGPASEDLTPLHYAALANDNSRVRALLAEHALVNARAALDRTPLILAAELGSPETLRLLLDAGAEVDAQDQLPQTALIAALNNEAPEAALLLVRRGANPNVRDVFERNPLLLALMLPGSPRDERSGVFPANPGYGRTLDELIGALLAAGAEVNGAADTTALALAVDQRRSTPEGRADWVRALLDRGADVNADPTRSGGVLFDTLNPSQTDLELPRLLLERGARLETVNRAGNTVLLEAIAARDFALARLLLEKGAKVNVKDSAGKTPLHWAAFHGEVDLVTALLERGAGLNLADRLGQTPLALARKAGKAQIATLLAQRGAVVVAAPPPVRNRLGQLILKLPLPTRAAAGAVTVRTGEKNGVPVILVARGGGWAAPVSLAPVFIDRAFWSGGEWNDVRYQLGRGYYAATAYEFTGLVTAGGQRYLGVRWYSPGGSFQPVVRHVIFQLRVTGGTLELTALNFQVPASRHSLRQLGERPRLNRSPAGKLRLIDPAGTFELTPPDTWKPVSRTGRRKSH